MIQNRKNLHVIIIIICLPIPHFFGSFCIPRQSLYFRHKPCLAKTTNCVIFVIFFVVVFRFFLSKSRYSMVNPAGLKNWIYALAKQLYTIKTSHRSQMNAEQVLRITVDDFLRYFLISTWAKLSTDILSLNPWNLDTSVFLTKDGVNLK